MLDSANLLGELPQKLNSYLPTFNLKDKLYNNSAAITIGSIIGLSFPLLLIVDQLLPVKLQMADKVYFLVYVLGPSLGIIVTDFLLMFFAGYVAANKSWADKLLSSLAVGIIVPTITAVLNWGLIFFDSRLFVNIFIFCAYAALGGLCSIYLPFGPKKPSEPVGLSQDWQQFQG